MSGMQNAHRSTTLAHVSAPREVGAQALASNAGDGFDGDRVARRHMTGALPVGHRLLGQSELAAQGVTPTGLLEHFLDDGVFHSPEYESVVPDESSSVVLQIWHMQGAAYAPAMTFGSRLKAAREAKGLSQTELGKGLNTGGEDAKKAVVSGWENDHHYPRVDQLMLICNKLGVGADFLLFGEVSATYRAAETVVEKLNEQERAALLSKLQPARVTEEYKAMVLGNGSKAAKKRVSKKQA